jgi:hypothetical protein
MKRREFIKKTGYAGVIMGFPKPKQKIPASAKRIAVIRKLVRIIVPQSEEIPVDPEKIGLPQKIENFISSQIFFIKEMMRAALKVLEYIPYFTFKFKRFSDLPDEEAEKIFVSLRESRFTPLKGIYLAMKSIINFMYYSSPEVWNYIGYEGPLLKEEKR